MLQEEYNEIIEDDSNSPSMIMLKVCEMDVKSSSESHNRIENPETRNGTNEESKEIKVDVSEHISKVSQGPILPVLNNKSSSNSARKSIKSSHISVDNHSNNNSHDLQGNFLF